MTTSPLTQTVLYGILAVTIAGCAQSYPGGLTQQEWNRLPPDQRAALQLQQDQLDEQRRANSSRETIANNTGPTTPVNQYQDQPDSSYQQPPVDPAQPTMKWTVIGQQTANIETGETIFPVGQVAGSFHAVRFTVSHGEIDVRRVVLTFGNGDQLDTGLRGRFDDHSVSSPILFPGGDQRKIDHIEIAYYVRGRAVITVLGGR